MGNEFSGYDAKIRQTDSFPGYSAPDVRQERI